MEKDKAALLERAGYSPVRYFYLMVRPNLADIEPGPLPPGLELRPVRTSQLRAIWEAECRGLSRPLGRARAHRARLPGLAQQRRVSAQDLESGLGQRHERSRRHGAGLYRSRAERTPAPPARLDREHLCSPALAPAGLARALIAGNLRELKAHGMTEAALGVDSESLTGALRVYASMGFRSVRRDCVWRKAMPASPP